MSFDLVLDANRDLDFGAGQRDGLARVKQQIEVTLLTFRGEWFLNVDWGVPYFDKILIKTPRRAEIESIIRAKVLDVPGVRNVPMIDIAIDNATRRARITLEDIETEYGSTTVEVNHG